MPDVLGIGRQRAQRLAGGLEQRGVDHPLMAARNIAQPRRQREGDQEVGTRQQAIGLLLEPGLGLVALAGRAMPVAARAAHGVHLAAVLAAVEHRPQLAGAAGGDVAQHLLVRRGHRGPEPLEIGPAVPPHHLGDGGHGSGLHQRLDPVAGLLVAGGGEVEVDHRGLQRAVAEVLLDQPEVDPGFEQMGRVAMSQRVDRDGLAEASGRGRRGARPPGRWTAPSGRRRSAAWR